MWGWDWVGVRFVGLVSGEVGKERRKERILQPVVTGFINVKHK